MASEESKLTNQPATEDNPHPTSRQISNQQHPTGSN